MFQKYGGREPTSSIGTEPPFHEFEEPTTMKTHHMQRTRRPVTETTQAARTSATTESRLIRLVALETTEAIKPTNFTTSPATTTTATTTTPTTTTTTPTPTATITTTATTTTPTAIAATTTTPTATTTVTAATTTTATTITTPDLTTTTERLLQQRKDSTDFTTPATTSSTENYLKQQIMFISSAATTEESLTQSEQYDMTTKAIKRPLVRLVERTTTTSTTPVSSLDTEQPLSTTTEKTSMQMEGNSDDESGRATRTETKQMEYTVSHAEKSEQPSSATSDLPVHWLLRTTISVLTTDLPDTTQHLEYKMTPNLVQPEPETTSTTGVPLFKYETTDLMHTAESTKMTFMTEHSQPEDQVTRQHLIQWLNHGKQSTDTVRSSTLHSGTDYSASFSESVTSTTIFERDGISDHSESKTATEIQPISSSGTRITETEDPMINLTTPATKLTNIFSTTDSTSVNNQSVFTTNNNSTVSHASTAASTQSTIDRSTAPYDATFDITDMESTTPTNLLTSPSSSSPDIQPINTFVITDTSTDSTAITPATSGIDATDSSVSDIGDISSQSVSAVPFTDVSRILTTTDEPLRISVTGPTTAAVTGSSVSTWHSPTASDATSTMSLSCKSQEIIVNATVAPGWLLL